MKKNTFRQLSFRDKCSFITALASFILGWLLVFVGLFLPVPGELSASVLTCFGSALTYTGYVFGIYLYSHNLINQKNETDSTLQQRGVPQIGNSRTEEHL